MLFPVCLSGYAFFPILGNYFYADDFIHLYQIANGSIAEFLLRPWGGHLYLVRNLIFYLSFQAFGVDERWYFVTVFLIHLVNVGLFFGVLRLLTGSAQLACGVAALWGVSALNEGSLGWYSAFGHVLAGTFLLCFLYDLARHCGDPQPLSLGRRVSWYLLLLAGSLSFGVGLPVAMISGAIVFLLLPVSPQRSRVVWAFASLALVVPLMYLGLVRAYAHITSQPHVDGAEQSAMFFSIALKHWSLSLMTFWRLSSCGICRSLLLSADPRLCDGAVPVPVVGTFASILLVGGLRSSQTRRRQLVAFILLFAAAYAIVALGRTPLALIFGVPLEAVGREPRYHYVAPLALWAMPAVTFADQIRQRQTLEHATLVVAAVIALLGAVRTNGGIDHHANARAHTEKVVETLTSIVALHAPGDTVLVRNRPFFGVPVVEVGEFPGWAALFSILYGEGPFNGRWVYFVEQDPAVLNAVHSNPGSVVASLLVGPEYLGSVTPPPPTRHRARPNGASRSR